MEEHNRAKILPESEGDNNGIDFGDEHKSSGDGAGGSD
jgi:hypothetical protein